LRHFRHAHDHCPLQPATVSKRSRGETGKLSSRVAAIRASRSRRAAAMSKHTVLKRSLPAWRQQTAYLPRTAIENGRGRAIARNDNGEPLFGPALQQSQKA
jgi:hypothetical protein